MHEALLAHLHWTLTDGVGPVLFSRIVERFGDAATGFTVPAAELANIKGIGLDRAGKIVAQRDDARRAAEAEVAAAAEQGVRILCRDDVEYPHGLKQIDDAPIVLFVKGELRPTDHLALGIVGSRRCSIYGSEQARRFGELLAGAGFTIVSGLARGIDAFAHHGAVDAGGRTLAVMGSGLNDIYPPENRALAEKLLSSGAWISELPLRTVVRASNFPARNRIIAGLSLGVLVVEAAARSGALITARLASEYNREVFAIPGRVQDPMSIGTNKLIRDGGAKLVTCLEDILDELGETGAKMRGATTSPAPPHAATRSLFEQQAIAPASDEDGPLSASSDPPAPPSLSPIEQRAYAALAAGDAMSQDALIRLLGAPAGEALAALTALELKGLVRRLPGQQICRRK